MKKLLRNILATSLAFTFFSCNNILQQSNNNTDKKSADGGTYIVLNTSVKKTTTPARDIAPDKDEVKAENLTNLVLSGKETGPETSTMNTIAEAETLSELQSQKIKINPGSWTFKLSAELNGIVFSGEKEAEIKEGVENTIRFVLTSESNYGGLEITIEWTNKANKVVATLLNKAKTEEIATETYDNLTEDTTSVTFTRDIKKAEEQIGSGTYYLKFDFYNETTTGIFDTYESYVSIADGLVTRKNLEITLDKTFDIIYELNGENVSLAEGELQPLKYSPKSTELTLPIMKKPGYFWGGWYENEDFSGEPVTAIPAETGDQKTYYAKWNDPVLYVSGTGDDKTGDGTEGTPYESIDKACEEIIATGDSEMAWVIYIMGDVTGPHNSTKKAGERSYASNDYGRSNIPETLTLDYASSILLIGANEVLDADDNPQDMIDRGLSLSNTSSDPTGTALAIFTEVPVTIKRLMITKGSNSLDCYNTTSGVHGGGLYISADSTVTLDDDTLIINNGYRSAGGVFNDGTLYMVGKAYIGDRTATTVANGDNFSNTGAWGAGLYNKGTVYLGTEEKDLEGGIFYNFGSTGLGGGIYSECGTIEMRSGEIAYNDGASQGGGVYIRAGTFNMTGGSIHHNSTGGSGGGVFVGTGATFNFSGGTISANWATNNGGGVYIDNSESIPGIMYMYGTAVVGDKDKTSAPTSKEGANATNGNGAGIYVNGYFYMGYSSYTSETAYETADLTDGGGIYYSYNAGTTNNQGGALYINGGNGSNSSDKSHARIRSGTIANNYAEKGGAAYIAGANTLLLGGNVKIPSGADHKNDIRYAGSYRIFVEDTLASVSESDPIYLTPASTTGETYYSEPVIKLGNNYPTGKTLADVVNKFKLSPLTNTKNGIVTHWIIDVETGIAVQDKITFYVASNGLDSNTGLEGFPLPSISKVIDKINARDEADKDYVIEINGEILGPQTIADTSETETIKANSIYIKGKNTSSATLSDVINANLGENEGGSALTIDTKVPVTLYYIGITGGHGKEIGSGSDAKVAGGGLYIEKNATVSLEGKTHIYGNTNYYGNTTVSGAGGGVYVGENTKLYIPGSAVQVRENKGTHYGAGVYIANGAYVKITAAATILNNSFDDRFTQSGQAVDTYGGGIYLADNATFEMTEGKISDNTANTAGSALGLGNGVFVSGTAGSEANFKLGHYGMVGLTNDVYLQNNVPIEIISSIDSTSAHAARITPDNYPSSDEDEIILLNITGSSLYMSSVAPDFEITPQTISGGQKQYWYIDNTGKLTKRTGMGLTVTFSTGLTNDIAVSVTQGGTSVEDNVHLTALTSGSEFTFTATTGFASYKWTLDGVEKSTSNILTLTSSDISSVGTYDVYLEAKDSTGKYYGYTAQIRVSSN